MLKQFWHNIYDDWFSYHNPEIHELGLSLGLSSSGEPEMVDGIVKASFSDASLERTKNNLAKINKELGGFYLLNSHGMRCDEFKSVHNGKHVLFAGCSITIGEGMPLEHTWSHLVYSNLLSKETVSGYFNISNPGFTIISIIWQLFAYFKKFGNPNIIFLNIPDIDREIRVVKSDDQDNVQLSDEFSGMLYYAYYSRLDQYCKENNISLYAFTWDYGNKNHTQILDLRHLFNNFYMPSLEQRWEYDKSFNKKIPKEYEKFLDLALDNAHPGIKEHSFLAEFIYNIYRENNND